MKKALVIVLVMALLCIISVGGTLSYFTDTDGAANTMTVGKVEIEQHEKDSEGNPYKDGQKLYPAVILGKDAEGNPVIHKDAANLWVDADINNEIDKIVTVTNTGSEPAYIRTLFAFETGIIYKEGSTEIYGYIHDVYIGVNGTMEFLWADAEKNVPLTITVGGKSYALAVCVYKGEAGNGVIKPEEITESSLRQFFLSPNAGNEFFDLVGGQYDILVLSQAVQAAGFENAADAFAAAFPLGENPADTYAGWFNGVN